jgi:ABC-2 type transport system permease protein
MIGGAIMYLDDKTRGVHEGYLVTPITKLELVLAQNVAGTIKATVGGVLLTLVGALAAGATEVLEPARLLALVTLVVLTSFAFMAMTSAFVARMSNPIMPRAIFGMLNTLLYFPSGAVYPQQGFPGWMQVIAVSDPFTYAVHAFKSLLLKNTGFAAISYDLGFLLIFSLVTMGAATWLFKRTL